MSSFHERQKNLFNQLKDAEDQCGFSNTNKATSEQDFGTIDRRTYKKLKHEMKPFKGRESIYKRTEAKLKECVRAKTIPDHITNPKKWVYYSLADVTPEQMSESTNTATALSFIREMEDRDDDLKMDHLDETGLFKKPTFQISKTIKKEEPRPDEKAVFKSNKVIMPEYVVGVTKKKNKKIKVMKKDAESSTANLKLNHLYDEEDDE